MENLDKNYDVIIVGAGTGGTTAARFIAKNGFKVCLIDAKKRAEVGNKICGDAVGTEIFKFLQINVPKGEELSCHVKGGKLYAPNLKKCLTLTDPKQAGYIVNRLEFGQRLLNEALNEGVTQFLDNTRALDLIYDNNQVSGVLVRLNNGDKTELKAKLVIDASGFHTPLRKKIRSPLMEHTISDLDSIICYREIIHFPKKDQAVDDQEYITIILDQQRAPGGYIWYFPKDSSTINLGLGVYMELGSMVKKIYKQEASNKYITTSNAEIISTGGGVVPVRRPLWSCAADGILLVGDAACHVNPLHGGGIDPSMRAGYYAAETAIEAIKNNKYSLNQLWIYNRKIMTTFGSEFAALDLLRIVLQRLSNDSLNFGLGKDILTSNEILDICSTGQVRLSLFEMATKAIKGIFNPKLMLDLNYLRIKMNDIAALYRDFPKTPEKFDVWKGKVTKIYQDITINKTYG